MNLISKDDLKSLITQHSTPGVSLFMPTIRAGAEIQQNPIRYKNLLRDAENDLISSGLRAPEARALLGPAHELINNENFWKRQSDGLAVFIADGVFQFYRVPLNLEERLVVNHNFYVKPLLPLFSNNGRFFILAISKNHIRMFEGTRDSVDELDIDNVPPSLAEALRWDDPEEHLGYHGSGPASTGDAARSTAGSAGSKGGVGAIYHGQGSYEDDEKTNLLRYFQKVASGLEDMLAGERIPLVLAGDNYLFSIFREASNYPYVTEEGISGNPDEKRAQVLHAEAWEIVAPHFKKLQEEAANLYHRLEGKKQGRSSSDIQEIVPAANYGQVEFLFVPLGLEQWGTFDVETGQVELADRSGPQAKALLDLAATYTFLNGGTIFAVQPEEIPGGKQVAAVFRYDMKEEAEDKFPSNQ